MRSMGPHSSATVLSSMAPAPMLLANAGLPMLAVQLPLLAGLIVPIIVLEAAILIKKLHLPWRRALSLSAVANAASTLVGVPLTWAVLFGLQVLVGGAAAHGLSTAAGRFHSAVLQAPWLMPYQSDFYWLIPTANLVLLSPYFLVSGFAELWVVRRQRSDLDPGRTKAAVWLANAATYGLLLLGSIAWLIRSVDGRWPIP